MEGLTGVFFVILAFRALVGVIAVALLNLNKMSNSRKEDYGANYLPVARVPFRKGEENTAADLVIYI